MSLMDGIYFGRNIKKEKDALDPINLENVDLMEEWVAEEPEFLKGEDLDWESIEEPLYSLTLKPLSIIYQDLLLICTDITYPRFQSDR
jgi:hypothetical protein